MQETPQEKQVLLRKKEEYRIVAGHPWVFSNEISSTKGNPVSGDVVAVLSDAGKVLGYGLYHAHSLIAVRLLSMHPERAETPFFVKRFERALALRTRLFPGNDTFRLVHGESDFLPGLIVDKYSDYLSIQTLSLGMDMRLDSICDALTSVCKPKGIIERNESPLRALEGLPDRNGILRGTGTSTTIVEHGLRYEVDMLHGQKTGFFLDQRENRLCVRRLSHDARVLDCFCNDGGFALNAARGGARSVTAIDISSDTVNRATHNASLNNLSDVQFIQGDVNETLARFSEEGAIFDLIILDPPSFTRSRKHVSAAKHAYRQLHQQAMRLLSPSAILFTASCSHHIRPDVFLDVISDAARREAKSLQLLEWRGASPDHPILPGVAETEYLKAGVFRVL